MLILATDATEARGNGFLCGDNSCTITGSASRMLICSLTGAIIFCAVVSDGFFLIRLDSLVVG